MKQLLFIITSCLVLQNARAGSYNFYFNNTEQGDHSTAAPQVVVKDEKGNIVSPDKVTSSPSQNSEEKTSEPTNPADGNSVATYEPQPQFPTPQWRIAIGTAQGNTRGGIYENINGVVGTLGSLFYFPHRKLGFGFQAGRFLGPEVEYQPFGIKQGFGKMNFSLSTAILSDTQNDFKKNMFVGGQASINILKDLGFALSLRFTPYDRDNKVYAIASWNLHLLF